MQFTIRQAVVADFKTLQSLNHLLFRAEYENGHDGALLVDWPLSDAGALYLKKSLSDPTKIVLLAEDEHKSPVGYIIGSSINKFTYRTVVTGELENMFILPSARKQGIGKALVEQLKIWMKEKGVDRMYVQAYGKNENAIHFYDKCGFSLIDIGMEMKL